MSIKRFLKLFYIWLPLLIQVLNADSSFIYFCNIPVQISSTTTVPAAFMKTTEAQEFRIKEQDLKCSNFAESFMSSNISDPTFFFYQTGDIVVPRQDFFLPEEYCISKFSDDFIEIKYCQVRCGETHVCIHKCCPPNQLVDINATSLFRYPCTPRGDKPRWSPVLYDSVEGCGERTKSPLPYHFQPLPSDDYVLTHVPYKHVTISGVGRIPGARFRLMRDGNLMVQDSRHKWFDFNRSSFCIDGMTGPKEDGLEYSGQLHEQVYFDISYFYEQEEFIEQYNESENGTFFLDDEQKEKIGFHEYFYITLFLIGSVFLFAIAALYLLIWEKHNIHGWTIFAYVTSMFFMFVFLATARIISISKDSDFIGTTSCKNIGILAHFFYLSTMCWLTIINVDLWLTFRNVKPVGGRRQHVARFIYYSLFAIGCPFVIVLFAVILDSVHQDGIGNGSECVSSFILPQYGEGEGQCYIAKEAHWPWLYIPMTILLGCNIVTFSSTVFSLVMYRRNTRNAVASNSNQAESVILFAKLFVVAGISWVFELISNTLEEPWWIWMVFDSYNLLQAVLIFVIFAMKRENVIFLFHKYPKLQWLTGPLLQSCYSNSFDPERTDMTGISGVDRNSKFHFRKGSGASVTAMISRSRSERSESRRDSGTSVN